MKGRKLMQVHANLPWTVIDPRTDDIMLPFHKNAAYCTNAPGGLSNSLYFDFPLADTPSHSVSWIKLDLIPVTGEEVPTGQQQAQARAHASGSNHPHATRNLRNISPKNNIEQNDNNNNDVTLSPELQKQAYMCRLRDTASVFEFNDHQPLGSIDIAVPSVIPSNASLPSRATSSGSTDSDEEESVGETAKTEWHQFVDAKKGKAIFSARVGRISGESNLVRVHFKFMINSGQFSRSKFSFRVSPLHQNGSTGGDVRYSFPVFVMSKKNTIGTNAVTSLVCEKINLVSSNLKAQKMSKIKLAENSKAIIAASLSEVIKLTGCAEEMMTVLRNMVGDAQAASVGSEFIGRVGCADQVSSMESENSNNVRSNKRDRDEEDDGNDDMPQAAHTMPAIKKLKFVSCSTLKGSKPGALLPLHPHVFPSIPQYEGMPLSFESTLSVGSTSWLKDSELLLQTGNSANTTNMKTESEAGMLNPLATAASNSLSMPLSVLATNSFSLTPAASASLNN